MSHACGHAAAGRSAPRVANAGPVTQAQQSRSAAVAYSRAARSLSAGWCGRTQCLCLRRASARVAHGRRGSLAVRALRNIDQPEALLFDCDGVLVDTEADGHRVAFNEAFKQKGLDHQWGLELYGKLLETGGGKERMTAYFTEHKGEEPFRSMTDPAERKAFVAELHRLKTDIFMRMVESGAMPLRPGVQRLIGEAAADRVPVAICSTSNERAVTAIRDVLLGPEAAGVRVFAGDCVPRKKPDPAIYLLAASELGVDPARCVVVEDSRIGMLAATSAGMRCIVTTSSYTADEDFAAADAVFDCIGDAGDERFSLSDLTTPGITALRSRAHPPPEAALFAQP